MTVNRLGFNEMDKYSPKHPDWMVNVLGVGEKTWRYNMPFYNIYFDPDIGLSFDNGGRGTQSNPFKHPINFLDLIDKYNISKNYYFLLHGNNKTYEINGFTLNFDRFNYIIVFDFVFDIYSANSDFSSPIFVNSCNTFALSNIFINLYNSHTWLYAPGLESVIGIVHSFLSLQSTLKITNKNSSAFYYSGISMHRSKCRFDVNGTVSIESIDGTSQNAPCTYGFNIQVISEVYGLGQQLKIDSRGSAFRSVQSVLYGIKESMLDSSSQYAYFMSNEGATVFENMTNIIR